MLLPRQRLLVAACALGPLALAGSAYSATLSCKAGSPLTVKSVSGLVVASCIPVSPPPPPPPPSPPPPPPSLGPAGPVFEPVGDDGSSTAPLSIPQFPHALDGMYHPPWKVGDVDPGYSNGNPLHGQTKDWLTNLPACATLSTPPIPGGGGTTYNWIRFGDVLGGGLDGNPGCSFVGLDFTTHGGVAFYGNAGSHAWFDEDDFKMVLSAPALQGSDVINCSACLSASITRYDFNGNAPIGPYPPSGNAGLIQFGGSGSGPFGPLILKHGRSVLVSQHVVDGGAGPNQTLTGATIAFNTVYQTGTSSQDPNPAHGEFAYLACGAMTNIHEVFNTVIEDGTGPIPLSNTAGLALTADTACFGSASTTNSELGNDLVLMLGPGGEHGSNGSAPAGSRAFFLGGGAVGVYTGNDIHDNYFTMGGAYYPSDPIPAGNKAGGNYNAKTGEACDLTQAQQWMQCP